ncbi:2-hydroxyacid dehydrogenase [Sphingopyxis sp. MSC1_008]|jgi:phosphoglycerate dehydrogenase-like enzyme|uniref:2-hydroxyacid dehydrogenase n=1 Tax=Sphingopyxis sp. MSC1_008 TaxID=2909265 RepID=UPI0020C17EA6|nr:2-hydroxyacid dehydrogenase [Sphingopyxis sp. MSC1_008]
MTAQRRGSDVLLIHENMRPILAPLQAAHRVHCLWDQDDPLAFLAAAGDAIGVIVTAGENRIDPSLVERLPGLGLIVCVGSGYDGVDVAHCAARGIAILSAVGANADDVADYALGLAIAAWRGIVADDHIVRTGGWLASNRLPQRHAMRGAPAGIVGLGAIGRAVAQRLDALGMNVRWWGPRDCPDAGWPRAASLHALATQCRLLIVCCRADDMSRGLIDADVLEALGPTGILVNVSRGSVIDEAALIDALKAGSLGGAALDVFETEPTPVSRWADVPNVILTPHSAGVTIDTLRTMIGMAIERVAIYLGDDEQSRGELLKQSVV